jgi:multidrug efflux pump subunit AcrA (membrane-fusion protein)
MTLQLQAQALLDLVETDRARQVAAILDEARARAAALRAQAHADARRRMREAFAEQRALHRDRLAAAQARLATERRLHEQQRTAALLQRARQRLPDELLRLWLESASRAAWVATVIAAARVRMPHGPWRIVHAPDWPLAEQQALARGWAGLNGAPAFEPDAKISAGLKVAAAGNLIDGTLDGMVADRSELESSLLRLLETSPAGTAAPLRAGAGT